MPLHDAARTSAPSSGWARRLVLVLCCLLVGGCAGRGDAAASARERASWHRVRTEHIELTTDLDEASAMTAALALERTREALLRSAWSALRSTRQTARAHVVVLADGLDFERYFGRNVDGAYNTLGGGTIVLWGSFRNWERRPILKLDTTVSTLRHELAHHLAAGIYGRQPRWFAEGLAQFLETIDIRDDGTKAVLGRPNPVSLQWYRAIRSLGVKDALAWGRPSSSDNERETEGLYGLSWVMVSWMFNTQRAAFDAYQAALARGEEPDRAWSTAFGEWKLEDMDKALYQYALHGEARVYDIDLAPVTPSAVTAQVSGADIHALRAQLALMGAAWEHARGGAFGDEAEREIAVALQLEPGNVAALRLSHLTKHPMPADEVLQRLREQTRLRPDDGEAWLLLGARAKAPAEREDARRKAVALLPDSPAALNNLAWILVQSGRAEEALPLAIKASLRAPWDAAVLDTHAACLFAVGRCPDALRLEYRALDNLPERTRGRRAAQPYLDALERYQRACGGEAKP